MNTTPPPFGKKFSNSQYINNIVYVPKGTLGAYQQAEGWKNFWNLQEYDYETGTVDLTNDNVDIRVYGTMIINTNELLIRIHNLAGKLVYTGNAKEIKLPGPGLYVITHDSRSVKILAK